jgi:predicted O-methyltransferase YrrM
MNRIEEARESLREELRFFPDNVGANDLLAQVAARLPGVGPGIGDGEFQYLLQKIRPYTMLSEERLHSLYTLARRACEGDIPGNFVECGVAGGGSSALLAAVIKRHSRRPRILFAFDTFEGMPTPTADDTHGDRQADETGWGTGTCAAPESSVREACSRLGTGDVIETVRGYFRDTLPGIRDRVGIIALLHMDADWYESTRDILVHLYDRIGVGGLVQVDDFGYWEGCAKAIRDFEAERNLRFEMQRIDGCGVWFEKPGTDARPRTEERR